MYDDDDDDDDQGMKGGEGDRVTWGVGGGEIKVGCLESRVKNQA